ncbi:MAG: beta-ketoacyl-[acyl-carrier-protein] synthase family protein [Caulobacteraceae bacterium]
MEKDNKVVVSGMGIVSALGVELDAFFEKLCSGTDATGPIETYITDNFRRKNTAQIRFPLPVPDCWSNYNRALQMALIAAGSALEDSLIKPVEYGDRMGLSIGTLLGGIPEVQKQYYISGANDISDVEKTQLQQFCYSAAADAIAYEFGINGIRNTIGVACASGTIAIGIAYKWIKYGRADAVLCGGVDIFSLTSHMIMSNLKLISPDRIRPFDENRKGFLLGEGAGMLVLESEKSANKRGAKIYCRVLGYGDTCDGGDMNHPDVNGAGLSKAMEKAIKEANISKSEIKYINAHGTATIKNDSAEIASIRKTFSGLTKDMYVSSIKGAIGHANGAAGAIEAIASILALTHNKLPPTINFVSNDEISDLSIVPNKAISTELNAVMSNSVAFGGINSSIIFGRYEYE